MRRVNDILFISIGIIDASLLGDLKKSFVFRLFFLIFAQLKKLILNLKN